MDGPVITVSAITSPKLFIHFFISIFSSENELNLHILCVFMMFCKLETVRTIFIVI